VLEQRLQSGEHQRKAFRRPDGLADDFIVASVKAAVRDADESSAVVPRWTRRPATRRPLLRVNQNRDVTAGSTNASKTSATGRRTSISAFAIGAEPLIARG